MGEAKGSAVGMAALAHRHNTLCATCHAHTPPHPMHPSHPGMFSCYPLTHDGSSHRPVALFTTCFSLRQKSRTSPEQSAQCRSSHSPVTSDSLTHFVQRALLGPTSLQISQPGGWRHHRCCRTKGQAVLLRSARVAAKAPKNRIGNQVNASIQRLRRRLDPAAVDCRNNAHDHSGMTQLAAAAAGGAMSHGTNSWSTIASLLWISSSSDLAHRESLGRQLTREVNSSLPPARFLCAPYARSSSSVSTVNHSSLPGCTPAAAAAERRHATPRRCAPHLKASHLAPADLEHTLAAGDLESCTGTSMGSSCLGLAPAADKAHLS